MKRIILFVLGWFLFFEVIAGAQPLEKQPDDRSVSRYFEMENGLKVLLISDPKFNKSAAALEAKVGSLMDPEDRQGLAHFLEHMLFLGTEKYPDVEEFPGYIRGNGGFSNGYTSESRMNFYFEVQHDAFEGALDRFSQFFISPLFSPEYIRREVKAVHSEHQKNLQQDRWRGIQLLRSFYRKDHVANHFATGDGDTLEGVERDEFVQFYNKYYSADQMSLVLLSTKGLDEMESMAREYFILIKNNHMQELRYDQEYLDPVEGLRLIKRIPVKDIRNLTLEFAIPGYVDRFYSKPDVLIATCIGHEGTGSLLSYLKKQDLATDLSAGANYPTEAYGKFAINISLTPKGLAQYRDVIRVCFGYIDLLRGQGVPSYIFDEKQHMAGLDFTFGNRGEGMNRASHLASNMNRFPPELAETVDFIYDRYDPGLIQSYLEHLRPEKALCMLTAKGQKTDQIEPYYGTRFSYSIEKSEFYASIKDPIEIKGISIPAPNPFIPYETGLLAERPVKLLDQPGAELWYAQDVTFNRPKVSLRFTIKLPKERINTNYMTQLRFYTECLNEQLNEIAYPAHEAGLDYDVSSGLEGITLVISGYTGSIDVLLNEIGGQLTSLRISQERFETIKDRLLRGWKNFKKGQAWSIARYSSRRIRQETYFSVDSFLKEAQDLTIDDLRRFAGSLYGKTRIEGLIHGNVTEEESVSLLHLLQSYIPSEPLEKEDLFEQRILVEEANDHQTYIEKLEGNNSCFWRTIHLGSEAPGLRMAASIMERFISEPFFTEMRTRQQLGYIVNAMSFSDNGQYYLIFLVQSESHSADEVRLRADRFIQTLPRKFSSLSEEEFARFKGVVRAELLERPKTINEKRGIFYALTYMYDKDFDRLQNNLDALDSLTKSQVAEIFSNAINEQTRKIVDILLFAKQHGIMETTVATIHDIDEFKAGREFVPRPKREDIIR